MYEAVTKKLPKRERSIYLRPICDVDNAITDLHSIMKRFVQTGETPVCNNVVEQWQYGLDDSRIDEQRIVNGESPQSVAKSPTDSFAHLSDEEMDLIPDAPSQFLELTEMNEYMEQSYTANEKARNYFRAKEREAKGKSVMSQKEAVANAVKVAESLGYSKTQSDAKQ